MQPGVEFGHETVVEYQPDRAAPLSHALDDTSLVFEAHSTDYQRPARLAELVRDRFCILKVGPALTFAMRETLYGLDLIASELIPDYPHRALAAAMEKLMLAEPRWWAPYYPGSPEQQRVLRHYSYSDRIRYYWTHRQADKAVRRLFEFALGRDDSSAADAAVSSAVARLVSALASKRANHSCSRRSTRYCRQYTDACAPHA